MPWTCGRINGVSARALGEVIIVRYADDFVVGFQYQDDAKRFRAALEERLKAFALSLHADKTRLIEFGRFAARTGPAAALASRKRSTSWASRISARRAGRARSSCAGRRDGSG